LQSSARILEQSDTSARIVEESEPSARIVEESVPSARIVEGEPTISKDSRRRANHQQG
jgi:precorrin-6x reductase